MLYTLDSFLIQANTGAGEADSHTRSSGFGYPVWMVRLKVHLEFSCNPSRPAGGRVFEAHRHAPLRASRTDKAPWWTSETWHLRAAHPSGTPLAHLSPNRRHKPAD